jgi:hypothetical protein
MEVHQSNVSIAVLNADGKLVMQFVIERRAKPSSWSSFKDCAGPFMSPSRRRGLPWHGRPQLEVVPYWYLFTALVGLNLFQSGFTNWCPMMTFLRKLGVGR